MSTRSTGTFSFRQMYCCLSREPQLCSRLKLTDPALSVAEYTLTGIETRPKLSESVAMERAAMALPLQTERVSSLLRKLASLPLGGRNGAVRCGAPLQPRNSARALNSRYGGMWPRVFIARVSVCFVVQ